MPDLDERLRKTILAARCNTEMRDRLRQLVDDSRWFQPIVDQLGGGHAVVRELLWVTKRVA
jgi:hypothetical protein